jgi:hypothetical protein
LAVLRILRPAEAAVRRLIFVASRKLEIKSHHLRPFPAGGIPMGQGNVVRRRCFVLTDRLVPMTGFAKPGHTGPGPRILSVTPYDPTIGGYLAHRAAILVPHTAPAENAGDHHEKRDGAPLLHRLAAIRHALDDIPGQARRLQRWVQRRMRLSNTGAVHTVPLRPGPPPCFREKPDHAIDRVLHDCHVLAHEMRLNTS